MRPPDTLIPTPPPQTPCQNASRTNSIHRGCRPTKDDAQLSQSRQKQKRPRSSEMTSDRLKVGAVRPVPSWLAPVASSPLLSRLMVFSS